MNAPTVHLRDPSEPLPSQSSYRNPSFYLFHSDYSMSVQPTPQHDSPSSGRKKKLSTPHDGVPKHKKEFEDFHTSNGVRTILGSIGPVQNGTRIATSSGMHSDLKRPVRMLLKTGYRYVYISRKFAMRHGFIPQDAAPGHYGYSGLVKCVLSACLLPGLIVVVFTIALPVLESCQSRLARLRQHLRFTCLKSRTLTLFWDVLSWKSDRSRQIP